MLVDFFIKKKNQTEKNSPWIPHPYPQWKFRRDKEWNGQREWGAWKPSPTPPHPVDISTMQHHLLLLLSFFPFSLFFHRTSAALVVAHFENATLDTVASNSRRCWLSEAKALFCFLFFLVMSLPLPLNTVSSEGRLIWSPSFGRFNQRGREKDLRGRERETEGWWLCVRAKETKEEEKENRNLGAF